MTINQRRAGRCRALLLILASLALAGALLLGYQPWGIFLSPRELVATAVTVLAGLLAALGIRELAGLGFDLDDRPWYAQPGGMVFLLVAAAGVNLLCRWSLRLLPRPEGLSLEAMPWLQLAANLFWLATLDRPKAAAARIVQTPASPWNGPPAPSLRLRTSQESHRNSLRPRPRPKRIVRIDPSPKRVQPHAHHRPPARPRRGGRLQR